MLNEKQRKAGILGIALAIIGIILRIFAYDIAWPTSYVYGGPRENTIWSVKEVAYQEIGLVLFIFGLSLLLIVAINWLWTKSTD